MQKWQICDVGDISVEKNKHVHIDMGGPNATKLHFNVGSRDTADAVVEKLEISRTLAPAEQRAVISPPPRSGVSSPLKKNGASVRFAEESPAIIPPRESSEEEEETEEDGQATDDGEPAVALYDFEGTGSDELTVQEGERLWIIEKEGEEWWKCRNEHGIEGVVPASYLEVGHKSSWKSFTDVILRALVEHLSLLSQKTTVLLSAKSKNGSRPKGKKRNEGSASARRRSERRKSRNNVQRPPPQRQRSIGSDVKRKKLLLLPKQSVGSVRRPQSVLNRRQKGDRARRRRCRAQPMLNAFFDIMIFQSSPDLANQTQRVDV